MDTAEEREQRALLRLHRWHMRQFFELGFSRQESESLELANVDWHEASDLLARGCPRETVLAILI